MEINKIVIGVIVIFFLLTATAYSEPVIPGEKGFGMETSAGAGGDIFKVTNLNPTGEGSLRACVNAQGPRICVFEVSGTIELEETLKITDPYITIAGQTAPSPGITLRGAGIEIEDSDVLVQHIRIRVGDSEDGPDFGSRDAIDIGTPYGDVERVVIDHVSTSWATDENIGTWSYAGSVRDVSVINSIISEGLHSSKNPAGSHSMGNLIGKNVERMYVGQNLFAHNNGRNPLIRDDVTDIVVANNYIYHPGLGSKSKIYIGTKGSEDVPLRTSIIGNDFTANPDDYYFNTVYIEEDSASDLSVYLEDNGGPWSGSDEWDVVHPYSRDSSDIRVDSPPIMIESSDFMPSYEVRDFVVEYAGARPFDRDAVDERIISNVLSGTDGGIIDSQDDVRGWPRLEENYREFVVPENPHVDENGNGYSNIEELLHKYSYWVEKDFSSEPETFKPEKSSNNAPIIMGTSLDIRNSSVEIKIETNVISYCNYDDRADVSYYDQVGRFDETYSTEHSVEISDFSEKNTLYLRCRTPEHEAMEYDFTLEFSTKNTIDNTNDKSAQDLSSSNVPKITSAYVVDGESATLFVETDTQAYCHYDERADISYYNQRGLFDETYSTEHSVDIGELDAGDYTYYLRCRSPEHDVMEEDYVLDFSIEEDTTEELSFSINGAAPVITGYSLDIFEESVKLYLETDVISYCHYDDRADISYYDQIGRFDKTYDTNHVVEFDELEGRNHAYYLRCRTPDHETMEYDFTLEFSN